MVRKRRIGKARRREAGRAAAAKPRATVGADAKKGAGRRTAHDPGAYPPWDAADWEYSALVAGDMVPLLGKPIVGEERKDRLREILKICRDYYPAAIELGSRLVQDGDVEGGLAVIDEGLAAARRHGGRKEEAEACDHVCEFLEENLLFERALECYARLMGLEDDKARVLDRLAECHLQLGDLDRAYEEQGRAVELEPGNARYLCNLGWVEMVRGNLGEAERLLDRSLELNGEDETTRANRETVRRMRKAGSRDLAAYLVRRLDERAIQRLEEGDDYEALERTVRQLNHDRLEAFKLDLVRDPGVPPADRADIWLSLGYVMQEVWEMRERGPFLFEEVSTVTWHLEDILARLIVRTGDVDEEVLGKMCRSLLAFYRFLAKKRLVTGFRQLQREMSSVRPPLVEKMRRYNAVRRRPGCTTAEKLKARDEVFGFGDFLPTIF